MMIGDVDGVLQRGGWGLVAPLGAREGICLIKVLLWFRRGWVVILLFWEYSCDWEVSVLISGQVDDWWRRGWSNKVNNV